ncbi:unnamed protein product, partial [Urochloa humidicola]
AWHLGQIPGGALHIRREPPPAPNLFAPGPRRRRRRRRWRRGASGGPPQRAPRRLAPRLLVVLLRLPSAAAAARNSVLSRRWRRLWAELPWLLFLEPTDLARPRAALAAPAAPALHLLHIVASDADPGDAAAVLLLAAQRLTGMLFLFDAVLHRARTGGSIDLPCFDKAVRIDLCL